MALDFVPIRDANLGQHDIAVETITGGKVQSFKQIRTATITRATIADQPLGATLVAANVNRIEARIFHNSAARLYVKNGSGASTTDYDYWLDQGEYAVEDVYTGTITGMTASDAGGETRVQELSLP